MLLDNNLGAQLFGGEELTSHNIERLPSDLAFFGEYSRGKLPCIVFLVRSDPFDHEQFKEINSAWFQYPSTKLVIWVWSFLDKSSGSLQLFLVAVHGSGTTKMYTWPIQDTIPSIVVLNVESMAYNISTSSLQGWHIDLEFLQKFTMVHLKQP